YEKNRHTYEKVLTPEQYLENGPEEHPVLFRSIKAMKAAPPRLLHPRLLGMVPAGIQALEQYGLQEILLRPDRTVTAGLRHRLHAQDVWRIEGLIEPTQVKTRVWLAPAKEHAVLQIEIERDAKGKRLLRQVSSTYRTYDRGAVWYPARVVYRETLADVLTAEEEVTVDDASFGTPTAPSTFALEGLTLRPGRQLLLDDFDVRVWDGQKPVKGPAPPAPPEPQASVRRAGRWFYLSLSSAFLLAAVFLTLRYVKGRGTAPPGGPSRPG